MMIALIFAVAIMALAAVAIAPQIGQQIRREREEELIERGKQYAVAIRKFYKKFGRYPSRLEELDNTNNIRFLRRRYKDPMTEKGEWRLVKMGESQALRRPVQGVGQMPGATIPGVGGAIGAGGSNQLRDAGTPASSISRAAGSGQTFGGGPLVGVASTSEREAIKVLDKKTHYNEWEFVYDPRLDVQPGLPGQVPQPGQQPGTPGLQPGPQQPPQQGPR
jgi:type II secretory pathway pseudopilin PulG